MPRRRVLFLAKFIHFPNNENLGNNDPNRDRLFKVREIADKFKERCHEVFYPGKDLCVDKSLLLYNGRLTFKHYIKTKRANVEIKFCEVCTSDGIMET